MTLKKPQVLLLSLAIATAVAACSKQDAAPADGADASATPAADANALTLDESTLPPVNRFSVDQLDKTKNACVDFGGYVNGTWLAANEITREAAHVRAYSDHVSDHPMLHFADEAVATTPSRGLKLLAPKMGWQVVDWRAHRGR